MSTKQWYEIRNAAESDAGPAELLIYDEIDSWFGVSPEQLVKDLAQIDAEREVVVRINSPGGYVYDGITILNALRAHKGKVTTVVDGLAASAASFIAMAGDEVVMNRNAEMMVHNGRGLVIGGFEDMRKMADNLERVNSNIASIYAEKAGGTTEDWLAVMAAETWYTANEAVEAGLADHVEEPPQRDGAAAKAKARFVSARARFTYSGRESAPPPPMFQPMNSSSAPAEGNPVGKEHTVPTLNEGLAELFGISADADDETILAAAKEALDERADDSGSDDSGTASVEPTLEQAAQVAAKAGLVLVDSATFDATKAAAQQGAEARAQQIREADERIVDSAIAQGKFAPARREHHLAALAADREGHTAVINALAPGLVPLAEKGHGVSNDATDDETLYASLFGKEA